MPLDAAGFVFRPQPGPQEALLSCPAEEIFFGGARGGGKTAGAIGAWLDHCGRYGAAAQGIFFRRRYKDLEGAYLQMVRFFRPLGAIWNKTAGTWTFPNGAILRLRHLWDERDAESYQGHEYTFLCFEEAGQWPSSKPVDMLRATLRSVSGAKKLLLLTGNPGGAGHLWLKARYITPARLGYRAIRDPDTGDVRVFIPSRLEDNAILQAADPSYARRLQQLGSKTLVRAWLKGDWDIVAGGFFDDVWNPERQVLPADFTPPAGWTYRRGFDWGSSRPAALAVMAVSDGTSPEAMPEVRFPKGSMVLCRELYTAQRDDHGEAMPNVGAGWENPKLGREVARTCLGLRFDGSVADPSIFTRQGGPSIYEQMQAGLRELGDTALWTRADNNRVAGWGTMRGMLRQSAEPVPEGPGLWVLESCTDWIRTVPVLQRDKDKPDDVDTEGEDHHGDATRYVVHTAARRSASVAPVIVR